MTNRNHDFIVVVVVFETESLYEVLAILELAMKITLALDSERSACLCLLSIGIKGMPHHVRQKTCFKIQVQDGVYQPERRLSS